MIRSDDRILTTHVGSLPRDKVLTDLLIRREAGEAVDAGVMGEAMDRAVRATVAAQAAAGIDIGNDGEQQRVGFQTYIPERMSGFGGESKRKVGRDFAEVPELIEMFLRRFPTRSKISNAPQAIGEVRYTDTKGIKDEIRRLQTCAHAQATPFADMFMTAPSPGIVATTMQNVHYRLARSLPHDARQGVAARIHGHSPRRSAVTDRCPRFGDGAHHDVPGPKRP